MIPTVIFFFFYIFNVTLEKKGFIKEPGSVCIFFFSTGAVHTALERTSVFYAVMNDKINLKNDNFLPVFFVAKVHSYAWRFFLQRLFYFIN